MIYTIKTQDGKLYKTTSRDIKRAAWDYIEDTASRRIATRGEIFGNCGDDNDLLDIDITCDGDWSGYKTESLRVRDNGKTVTIPFSAATIWSEDNRSEMFAFGQSEATVTRGDWNETVETSDILDEAGLCAVPPSIDYGLLAEEFLDNLPCAARFLVDEERGFGNEWSFYIDTGTDDAQNEFFRAVTREEAIRYLADAVMPRDEYVLLHGCEPFVAAYLR